MNLAWDDPVDAPRLPQVASEPLVPVFSSIEECDRWMLANPGHADALLRNLARVSGTPDERHDLRFATIPVTRDLDPRRYGIGLGGITAHMGELRPGELCVVGAREGMGKTAFLEKVAISNARDYKVLFVSLEMDREEIRDRMLAKKLYQGSLDRLSYERSENSDYYKAAQALLNSYDLLIWKPEKREQGIVSILDRAVKVQADLLIIDHSRMIGGWKPGDAAAQIMDTLSQFVRRERITTVLASQLNRPADGKRPHNANFQDTGKIEQSADRCLLLYRPFLGNPKKDTVVEVTVSKNRQGPCFRAHAWWNGSAMSFDEMTEEDESWVECCRRKPSDD